jgi:uncharacterized protein
MNYRMIFPINNRSFSIRNLCAGLILLGVLCLALPAWAQKEVPPPPDGLVADYAGMLSPQEANALDAKLQAYEDTTSIQIAVVLDRSLEGEDIFDYSLRIAESWGIGQQGRDNGVLIYIAQNDRQLYIQTGYGSEGFLPDAYANRIIDQVITPAFRSERYYQGLDQATSIIMQLGSGEYEALEDMGTDVKTSRVVRLLINIIIIIVIITLISRMGGGGGGRGYGGRGRRGGGMWWIPMGGGGFGGGGGGGFSGGGSWGGFGGGGFGGGGAGGGW